MSKQLPFVFTYWNPHNSDSNSLVKSYQNYLKDVSLANYTIDGIGNHLEILGENINAGSNQALGQLSQVMGSGVREVVSALELQRQEQINTNILLEDIKLLLKLPDSEKQRQLHLERGLMFMNQSVVDDSIITDAKDELFKAHALMPQDWFVLYEIGILHLFHNREINIALAKEYFEKALKYAKANIDSSKSIEQINCIFNGSTFFNHSDLRYERAVIDILQKIALCDYISEDYANAIKRLNDAKDINAHVTSTLYLLSKYNARTGNNEQSISNLQTVIDLEPTLLLMVSNDADFQTNDFVKRYGDEQLQKLRNKLVLIDQRLTKLRNMESYFSYEIFEAYLKVKENPFSLLPFLTNQLINMRLTGDGYDSNNKCCSYYLNRFVILWKMILEMPKSSSPELLTFLGVRYRIDGQFWERLKNYLELLGIDNPSKCDIKDLIKMREDEIRFIGFLTMQTKDNSIDAPLFCYAIEDLSDRELSEKVFQDIDRFRKEKEDTVIAEKNHAEREKNKVRLDGLYINYKKDKRKRLQLFGVGFFFTISYCLFSLQALVAGQILGGLFGTALFGTFIYLLVKGRERFLKKCKTYFDTNFGGMGARFVE